MPNAIPELINEHNDLIKKLIEVNSKSTTTKKEFVTKLVEISRELVKSGTIKGFKSNNLASYINQQLMLNKIEFPRNENFYSLFTESEKRGYGTNSISTSSRIDHEHKGEGDDFEKKCECGDILRLGVHYSVVVEKEESEIPKHNLKSPQEKIEKRPYSNPIIEYINRNAYLADDISSLLKDQVKKYQKYETVAKSLDDYYAKQDMDKLMSELKSLEAKLIHADKSSDARQKVGEFEKIKAFILQQTTHTVAHVAKIINITPKHMTNNVIRNIDRSKNLLKWFKTLFVLCPHCKKEFGVNLYDWFNEQCERCNLNNDMKQPILLKSK